MSVIVSKPPDIIVLTPPETESVTFCVTSFMVSVTEEVTLKAVSINYDISTKLLLQSDNMSRAYNNILPFVIINLGGEMVYIL